MSFTNSNATSSKPPAVGVQPWGRLLDGREAALYTLDNGNGLRVRASNHGATLVSIEAPDRNGAVADVVLGYDTPAGYAAGSSYFGAVVGRVANRVANARFSLDGTTHTLDANNTPGGIPCSLHGGNDGFDRRLWSATVLPGDHPALLLRLTSPDGDGGYPGKLDVSVTYILLSENILRVDYTAVTDRPTPVNLSQHTYWNLSGEGSGTILNHRLRLAASHYTPVNAGLIPTGKIVPVANTPFDFTQSRDIGERIHADDTQLAYGGGYDHNWVLDGPPEGDIRFAAEVWDPASGRVLTLFTNEPGIQFYSGNFLDGAPGKGAKPYGHRSGLALETQHFPDSPNQPAFPSVILRPGERFTSRTEFRFSTR
ncbi:MAG: galactose mutarotase [Puniceicoccales bacterium]|nr:galactose mutarotase [Puniceicoccales bacterium]